MGSQEGFRLSLPAEPECSGCGGSVLERTTVSTDGPVQAFDIRRSTPFAEVFRSAVPDRLRIGCQFVCRDGWQRINQSRSFTVWRKRRQAVAFGSKRHQVPIKLLIWEVLSALDELISGAVRLASEPSADAKHRPVLEHVELVAPPAFALGTVDRERPEAPEGHRTIGASACASGRSPCDFPRAAGVI